MTRVLRTLVHNWPLKLAAVGLATLLYGGLVLSQSTATLPVVIPVDPRDQPTGTFLLNTIRPVTEIRYFSPAGVQPIASDFEAWVDLSKVDPGSGPQSVSVQLRSVDPRVTVVGFQPQVVTVDLDKVDRKSVPVQVDHGDVPSNLELGATTVSPPNVDIVGPATVLARVVAARASVIIQPTGIDVDQDVELVAIDDVGNSVNQVKIEPATSRVTIPVFSDRLTKTLPIAPQVVGTPAAGFALGSVVATPPVVTVEGDVDELEKLTKIDTEPISISGYSSPQSISAPLALPTGIVALDIQSTKVDIGILAVTESRSFEVGIRFIGTKPGLSYTTELDRVLITVGGSPADLDRLVGATLAVDLDVNSLGPGKAEVTAVVDLPAGVTLVTANPPKVTVTVTALPTSAPSSGG